MTETPALADRKRDMEALDRLLGARHSCRAYRPDAVDPELIERLVCLSDRSPSWCNVQPWSVRVIGGAARRTLGDALLDAFDNGEEKRPDFPFPSEYAGSYGDRRRDSGYALYQALGVAKDVRARRAAEMRRNFDFFGAPRALILSTPKALAPYGLVDCGIFVKAFLLAAEAAGLGAIAQASVALYAPLLHRMLAIPDDESVVCAIAFGYPDPDHPANNFRTSRDVGEIHFIDTIENGTSR